MNVLVNTKSVLNRRIIRFDSIQEILFDVEQIPEEHITLGNWSFAQILWHLTETAQMTLRDNSTYSPPMFMKMIGPLMKGQYLTKKLSPGMSFPASLNVRLTPPESLQIDDEKTRFAQTMQEYADYQNFPRRHPVFGKLSTLQWHQIQHRHCELHLSFVRPKTS